MGLIRMHVKDTVHFVTNRTEHQQFMLLPSKDINQTIEFWLAKAKERKGRGIRIYAFVFMSNHFHILLKDTKGELAQFMCYFQSCVATAINCMLGREGRFWSREYDDVIVDGNDEFWNRYDYINMNPVSAGLVATPSQWRGSSSYPMSVDNKSIKTTMINKTRYNNAKRYRKNVSPEEFKETYELKLTQPDAWKHWAIVKRAAAIKERTFNLCKLIKKERAYKKPLGIKRISRQSPLQRPRQTKRKPRFMFFSLSKARLSELREAYRNFVSCYKNCMNSFVLSSGKIGRTSHIEWPPWSYPPSVHVPVGF